MTETHAAVARAAVILEPHPVSAEGLKTVLEPLGIEVLGEARDTTAALDFVRSLEPDVFIVELETPSGRADALRLVRELREDDPDLVIIVLALDDDPRTVRAAVAAGATTYLSKATDVSEIAAEIQRHVAPPIYLARDVPSVLIHGVQTASAARAVPHLTRREFEILRVVDGRSNREVAQLLWISDDTVKFHLANIYRKLGVSSRAEAVACARDWGLLDSRVPLTAA